MQNAFLFGVISTTLLYLLILILAPTQRHVMLREHIKSPICSMQLFFSTLYMLLGTLAQLHIRATRRPTDPVACMLVIALAGIVGMTCFIVYDVFTIHYREPMSGGGELNLAGIIVLVLAIILAVIVITPQLHIKVTHNVRRLS